MDYAALLREEAKGAHSLFHEFLGALSKGAADEQYFFFEGDDDPVFYVGQIQIFLGGRHCHEFVCGGRSEVLKVHELIARDGRAIDRAHFFIDRDHCDLVASPEDYPASIFQTRWYSFENYIVCSSLIRRFWVERMLLPSTDARLSQYIELFEVMHASLMKRMRLLMAVVLIGRGVDGHPQVKLNLNNVALDKVLKLDISRKRVHWAPNALQNFLAASNLGSVAPRIYSEAIRSVYRKYLLGREEKTFVRGKYELWFLVKFLLVINRELSDKKDARTTGLPRSRLREQLSFGHAVSQLSPLVRSPHELVQYLILRLGVPQFC